MKKRTYIILMVSCFLVFVTAGVTFAWAINHNSGTATNVVTVGKVSIQLKNDTRQDGTIYPEQPVGKDITVTNNGEYPAYIRLKIKKSWVGYQGLYTLDPNESMPKQTPSPDAIVLNVKNGWFKGKSESEGYDYYYYNKIVPTQKEIVFINDYYIATKSDSQPNGITNDLLMEYQGTDISIQGEIFVQAEAIQADYYEPEMVDEYIVSWPVMVEEEENSVTPTPVVITDTDQVAVVSFNSQDVELSGKRDDIFLDLTEILPGETKTKGVFIANNTGKEIPVYLYARIPESYALMPPEQQLAQMELLNELILTVGNEKKKILYYGPLFDFDNTKEMLSAKHAVKLGQYKPLEGEVIYVSVHLPITWTKGNSVSSVDWIFSIEKEEVPEETPVVTQEAVVTHNPVVTQEPVVTGTPTEGSIPTEYPLVTEGPFMETTVAPTLDPTTEPTFRPEQTPQMYTEEPMRTMLPTLKPMDIASMIPALTTKKPQTGIPEQGGNKKPVSNKKPVLSATHATKTGDETPIYLWSALCLVSVVGMVIFGKSWKRTDGGLK